MREREFLGRVYRSIQVLAVDRRERIALIEDEWTRVGALDNGGALDRGRSLIM